jgi:hypothetical protein
MKANELRIGNAILIYNSFEYVNRIVIGESGKTEIINRKPIQDIKPIPLTELLLESNGIFDDGMRRFIIPNCKYFIIEWEHLNSCKYVLGVKGEYGNDEVISEPFTNVHELQNLYFALTGEELTLKGL